MKKLSLLLALLATNSALAALPSPCSVTVPSYGCNFVVGLTGLYWRPSVGHLDYVQELNFNDAIGDLPNSHFKEVNHRYDWGYKAMVGYLFPCTGLELELTYTNYDHHQRDFVHAELGDFLVPTLGDFDFATTVPVGPVVIDAINLPAVSIAAGFTPPPTLISFTFGPLTVDIPDLVLFAATDIDVPGVLPTFASATARLDHNALDFDLKQHVNVGCYGDLNWFAGIRYAHLDHKLDATYLSDVNIPLTFVSEGEIVVAITEPDAGDFEVTSGDVTFGVFSILTTFELTVDATLNVDLASNFRQIINQQSRFEGLGPRLGFGGTYGFANGLGIVGEVSASLLAGTVKNDLRERFVIDTTGTVTVANITAEGEVGSTAIAGEDPELTIVAVASPIAVNDFVLTTPVIDPQTATFERHFHQDHDPRIVPNIDLKLGLSFTGNFNCSKSKYRVEAGYLASHYFNAQDRLTAVVTDWNVTHVYDTSFEGPYLSLVLAL